MRVDMNQQQGELFTLWGGPERGWRASGVLLQPHTLSTNSWFCAWKYRAVVLAASILVTAILVLAIKFSVRRQRPEGTVSRRS